ncbi:hypothetical protein B0T19DRAFT_274846 [Cercophora scortea]|uniref:Uncharacterized protein n=1 Tax=Cercophora scortea TaxID=314031 RepID=A0AAE0I7B6_9PEZI|nr:hypothetical protein B0T19DRAFT_274846 [Cercophora scortea]
MQLHCSQTGTRLPFVPKLSVLLVLGKAWPRPNEHRSHRRQTSSDNGKSPRWPVGREGVGVASVNKRDGIEAGRRRACQGRSAGWLRWRYGCACRCRWGNQVALVHVVVVVVVVVDTILHPIENVTCPLPRRQHRPHDAYVVRIGAVMCQVSKRRRRQDKRGDGGSSTPPKQVITPIHVLKTKANRPECNPRLRIRMLSGLADA